VMTVRAGPAVVVGEKAVVAEPCSAFVGLNARGGDRKIFLGGRSSARSAGALPGCPSGNGDIGLGEVLALEQESGVMRLGAGIGKTVAHIEPCGMSTLPKLSIGLEGEIIFSVADPNALESEQIAQPFHAISG
jgi:hypothetical protein